MLVISGFDLTWDLKLPSVIINDQLMRRKTDEDPNKTKTFLDLNQRKRTVKLTDLKFPKKFKTRS